MQFKRYGKSYQLMIATPEDLDHMLNLDEALWAATSAPISAFRCDQRVLTIMDRDGNGRITSDEMQAAWRWTRKRLVDRRWLAEPFEALPLSALDITTPEGQALKESAEYVLRTSGQTNNATLSLGHIRACLANLNRQPFNGDGVIVPQATSDPDAAILIADAVAGTGGSPDAGGQQGITLTQLETFISSTQAWLDWDAKGATALAEGRDSLIMPFGARTPVIYETFESICGKVDEYFELCRIMNYQPDLVAATGPLNIASEENKTGIAGLRDRLATEPLACLSGNVLLPLDGPGINPFYAGSLDTLRSIVLIPCLGKSGETLCESDWQTVKSKLQPYMDYQATCPNNLAERVPRDRLLRYHRGNEVDKVRGLIARDTAAAGLRQGMLDLERLWLFSAHLLRLTNNFTSFSELYNPKARALFERGSAVIDGRWFNLALKVDDPNAHQTVAKASNVFTIYLAVENPTGDGGFTVALPATHGTKGNLREGKRGVFFDVDGIESDARILKIIENPISLREALISPLLRLRDFIIGKIESISGAGEKDMEQSADAFFKPVSGSGPATAGGNMGSAGVIVGLGVATAALGSAFAYVSNTIIGMSAMQRLLSLLGAMAVVFVPVSLVAVLKLRSQDLSSLLEACGWAVNARLLLSRTQRRQFTCKAPYPDEARGTPRKCRWRFLLALAAGLALIVIWRACRGV